MVGLTIPEIEVCRRQHRDNTDLGSLKVDETRLVLKAFAYPGLICRFRLASASLAECLGQSCD